MSAPLIIDTDAGSDDLLAIAFLLTRKDVDIEAVTIATGLAHVPRGASNILRVLALAGKTNVPVYMGREIMERQFPKEWREKSDKPPGVDLPATSRQPEKQPAAEFLAKRLLQRKRPVRILALGPLTNFAATRNIGAVQEFVIMGGAVRAGGNLGDGGFFRTDNRTAEWNFFIDPKAAQHVINSGAKIRLIPLDATNKAPLTAAYLRPLSSNPLAILVHQILESEKTSIEDGYYYAWDPLAAVALVEPSAVITQPLGIEVRQNPPEEGRTTEAPRLRANAEVALDARPTVFEKIFLTAFR